MAPEHDDTASPPRRAWLARVVREMSPTDWLVLGFDGALLLAALTSPGPAQADNVARTLASVVVVLAALALVRGGAMRAGPAPALVHRLALYGTVQASYFILRDLLPLVNTTVVDEQLYRLDERLVGVEPTLALDRYVTPAATEWFAFFYFSYFFVLASHVLPFLFGPQRLGLLDEFATGLIGVVCIGELTYMLVPGFGPHRHLADRFAHPLPPGFWLDAVMSAVDSAGAQMDIFPSLHTGAPSYIAMFSFRHRHLAPFRFTWPIAAFFAGNIIVATIYLRWHYLVDVLAGLALALACLLGAAWLAPRERARRDHVGATTSTWLPLWPEPGASAPDADVREQPGPR